MLRRNDLNWRPDMQAKSIIVNRTSKQLPNRISDLTIAVLLIVALLSFVIGIIFGRTADVPVVDNIHQHGAVYGRYGHQIH